MSINGLGAQPVDWEVAPKEGVPTLYLGLASMEEDSQVYGVLAIYYKYEYFEPLHWIHQTKIPCDITRPSCIPFMMRFDFMQHSLELVHTFPNAICSQCLKGTPGSDSFYS